MKNNILPRYYTYDALQRQKMSFFEVTPTTDIYISDYRDLWCTSLTITGLNIDRRRNGLFHGQLTVGPITPTNRRSRLEPIPSTGVAAPGIVGPI